MTTPGQGGASIGIAAGKIIIDLSDVTKAQVTVSRESRLIAGHFQQMGQDIARANQRAKMSMSELGGQLTQLGQSLAGLGLGGAALATLGARTADTIKATEIRYRALLGTQQKVNAVMAAIKEQAVAFNLPVNQAVQQFGGLLPYLKGGTEEMKRLISVTSRLTILDPQQGFEGAAFALREAFSGSLVSLSGRFEISKEKLRELMAENGGDLTKALDVILDQMGLTEQAAKEMGNTFTNQLKVVGDEASVTFANMFGPFFEALTPALRGINDFLKYLNETNPVILQIAGGLLAVTAATSGLSLVAGNVLNAFTTLKNTAVALGSGMANIVKNAGKAAVGVGAAYVGVQAGIGLVKGLNIGGINDRAAATGKSAEELIGETFKQAVALVIYGLVKVGAELQIFFESVANFIGQFDDLISQGIERIGNALAGKGLKSNAEIAKAEDARARIGEAAYKEFEQFTSSLTLLSLIPGGWATKALDDLNWQYGFDFDSIQAFVEFLQKLAEQGTDPLQYLAKREQASRIVGGVVDPNLSMDQIAKMQTEAAQFLRDDPLIKQAQVTSTASGDEFQKRIQEIRESSDQTVRNLWEAFGLVEKAAEKTQEAAANGVSAGKTAPPEEELAAFTEFQDDIAAIERQGAEDRLKIQDDFARDSAEREADHQRDLARTQHDFDRDAAERAKDHERDMARMEQDERQRRVDVARQLERQIADRAERASEDERKIVDEYNAKFAEAQQEFQQEEKRRREDHMRELQRMEDAHNQRIRDAAANLDAQAVANEQAQYAQQRGDKAREFDEESARRAEDNARRMAEERQQAEQRLQESRANHALQEQERALQYAQQRTDAQLRYDEESLKRTEQHQLRIADMNEAFALERQKRQEELQRRVDDSLAEEAEQKKVREAAFNAELAELGNAEARKLQTLQNAHRNIEAAYAAHIGRIQNTVNAMGAVQGVFTAIGQSISNAINGIRNAMMGGNQGVARPGRPSMTAYATGTSYVPRTGIYQLHSGEVVLDRNVSAMMRDRLGDNFSQAQAGAMIGGSHRGGGLVINGGFTPQISISNAGEYSPEQLMDLVRRGTADALEEYVSEYLAG